MRKNKSAAKPGDDQQEAPGGHSLDRLKQFERERGLPESDPCGIEDSKDTTHGDSG